jgi:hypothetical protein
MVAVVFVILPLLDGLVGVVGFIGKKETRLVHIQEEVVLFITEAPSADNKNEKLH